MRTDFGALPNGGGSAHLLLWICRRLSTRLVDDMPAWSSRGGGIPVSANTVVRSGMEACVPLERDASTQHTRCARKKFFPVCSACGVSGLQPISVYKVSSSVNNLHFLWISRLTSQKSLVYARYKRVALCCIRALANLDKILRDRKSCAFAQTGLVDIKKLIHRRASGVLFTFW